MGVVPPDAGLPRAAARAGRPRRRAAHLRRGDHRLPRRPRRRAGALRRAARPDDHGQDHRRRPARRRLRRARGELMERIAPAGDVYQAGTLSGNPLAVAAGLATLARLDAAAYARLAETSPSALARGLRRPRRARAAPVSVQTVPGLLDRVLQRRAGRPTTPAPPRATSRLRRLVPRPARPRRVPAGLAVRGLVPVARALRRRRRADRQAASAAFEEVLRR